MPSRETLIDALLDETVRARRRRLNVTRALDVRFLGLKTVDSKLDRNIRALAVFGDDALHAATQKLAGLTHAPTVDALVHVLAACAAQAASTADHHELLEQLHNLYAKNHRSALRDAWWFYPISRRAFDLHMQRVANMLQSRQMLEHQLMATELAGRLGMLGCGPQIIDLLSQTPDNPLHRSGELALCRMGIAPNTLPQRIQSLMQGGTTDVWHALRLIASSGQAEGASIDQLLNWAQSSEQALSRLAWCLATISNPSAAHEASINNSVMDPALRTRVLALAGFPSGLIAIVRSLTEQNTPATPAQIDALAVFLGDVPMELSADPVDPVKREEALRAAVLKTLRMAHIPVRNEAKVCEWSADVMLAEPHSPRSRRLRYGTAVRPKEGGGVALSTTVLQMGSLMRQALYIEQSVQAGRPIGAGLSAYASSRLQLDVIGISDWLGQARAA